MYGMVMPRFVSAALSNQPLRVHGDGSQTRCFVHVRDVTETLVRLMQTPAAIGQVFNLGGDEEISINDLAQRVIQLSGSTSAIQHVSYEEAYGHSFQDMSRRVPKLDKIRSLIGFRPKLKLDQIIESVIEDQQK